VRPYGSSDSTSGPSGQAQGLRGSTRRSHGTPALHAHKDHSAELSKPQSVVPRRAGAVVFTGRFVWASGFLYGAGFGLMARTGGACGTIGPMLLKVTLSDVERDALNELRGGVPAATWVRELVRREIGDAGVGDMERVVADAEPARGRGPVVEPAEVGSVAYEPGREGGAPQARVGRTLAEMSGRGAFPKASRGKR
jgi:hypothetical protein